MATIITAGFAAVLTGLWPPFYDYAPILNAKQIEGEAIETPIPSESSLPTDEESSSDPQK